MSTIIIYSILCNEEQADQGYPQREGWPKLLVICPLSHKTILSFSPVLVRDKAAEGMLDKVCIILAKVKDLVFSPYTKVLR